jgi:tetratricopeptide (TPR) repeat protein
LALICLIAIAVYMGRVAAVYLAQQSAYSSPAEGRVQGLERAIRLTPDDAEFPYLLGRWLSASDQDDESAIVNLRKAVALNPNRGRYWLDLALVYQARVNNATGNIEKENEAVQSALNAEPGNPEIAAEAGESFLAAGQANRAFPLLRRALEQDPEAAKTIFQACWRETQDANLILAEAIPPDPELQLAFLRVLTGQEETTAANDVWQHIVAAHKSFPPQLSFFYFDSLLKQRDVTRFDRAWHELAGLAPNMQAYLPNDNLMVNASFELPLLNSGFDWRYEPAPHIVAGLDDKVAHSGSHSLSLSFDGSPAYDAGWQQLVPVQADADYEFSAWIKSENVTTSSGPRIAIVDAFTGANLLLTDDVLDTHPWQQLKGTFQVPAGTQLLAVKIIRAPADSRIRGQVWIDDLRLVKR